MHVFSFGKQNMMEVVEIGMIGSVRGSITRVGSFQPNCGDLTFDTHPVVFPDDDPFSGVGFSVIPDDASGIQ